jgi:hypothetical protein
VRGARAVGVLLAQQPVGDLPTVLCGKTVRPRAERIERVVGARAYLGRFEAQEARQVVIALALAQQELQD